MKTKIFFQASLLVLLLCNFAVKAQAFTISGKIVSDKNEPVADAVIQLLNKDSALVKTEISDAGGEYHFESVKPSAYFVMISAFNHDPHSTRLTEIQNNTVLPAIVLKKTAVDLKEITVTTRKPYIEREKGKLILNVENSISAAGSSAFEVIEKAPGVRIDVNDNLSLNGRPGTAIWIDGKPSPMTGSELSNYLKGIPSAAIEKIEIISNPSARYDAAGSSIINIIMKKDKRSGTNGNLNTFVSHGYYPKSGGGVSFNHRKNKINLYGSYNYSYRELFSRLQLRREFFDNNLFIGAFDQDNYFKHQLKTQVARAGIDYFINKKNTLGIMINGVDNRIHTKGSNRSDVFNSTNDLSSEFLTGTDNRSRRSNFSANVNFKHEFDSAGTSLTSDLDYASYGNTSLQNIQTKYLDLNQNEFQSPYLLRGDLNGALKIYAIKNDFNTTLGKKYKLEAGQKSSYVKADNALAFYDRSQGLNRYDSSKSNHFIYTENINAAYLMLGRDFKRWDFQLGLRAEQTIVVGTQLVNGQDFNRNYAQLFPNAVITRKFGENQSLEFNYGRRIRRPGYEQLNPFKFYLDPTTYKEGNPYLQPSITESFELSHSYKQKIFTSIGYGHTRDNIIEVIAPLTGEKRLTVQTDRNLGKVEVFTFNGSVPFEVAKWWHSSNNFNVYYAFYSGNIANTPLQNVGNISASLGSVNTFNLSSTLSAELSADYQAREVYAYDVIEPIWSLNIGVQKKVMKNNGIIKLNVSDVFYTNQVHADVNYTDYHENFLVTRDSRVATVSFTYKFGKNSVPGARRRQGGAEDVKERAGGTG